MASEIDPLATDVSVDTPAARPDVRVVPATGQSLEAIAALFNRGFEDYLVPIRMSPEDVSQMVRSDSVDLAASRVLQAPTGAVGFILVGSRGWTRRVSAMGVISEGRGRGLGRLLMEEVLRDAAAAGFRRFLLEVFEKNVHARTLYEHLGFRETQRLVGYERRAVEREERSDDVLKPIDPREMAKVVEYEAPPDLPWQLAAETVAAAGPPAVALRLEDRAYALVYGLTDTTATLGTLLVPHAVRRQGWGHRMVRALFARFPGRYWRLPARFPENLARDFFDHCGFTRLPLAQVEMARDLD